MNKDEELLQETLKIAKDYEEHGHSKRLLEQCKEQQAYYDMVNAAHRALINRWKINASRTQSL